MKIVVNDVSKKFKNITIIENINLKFSSGKIYGLVGRNGSGKSVFLKMLCGFYTPTTGEILFDGRNIIKERSYPPSTRALIERPNFLPDLSGYDNLELLAKLQNKIDRNDIEKTLKDVNLFDDKNKKYGDYSLGMKQKLGIAQVLMENPDVIILDEPFNGIEEKTVEKLRKILLKLKSDGKLIIIASHIKEDILQLADDVYMFDNCSVKKINNAKKLQN